jgi:hypothetical protein
VLDQLCPLADQEVPRPVQHQCALLLDALDRHKTHRWPRHGLADCRRIVRVVLATLRVGFDIGRRHKPRVVPELLELACPLVRRCAGFHANEATRQIGKELKNLCSTNTLADHHRATHINTVNLKHRLRNIDTNRANIAHGRLPSMWLRFDPTTLWHSDVAERAPSTASFAADATHAKIQHRTLWSKSGHSGHQSNWTLSADCVAKVVLHW